VTRHPVAWRRASADDCGEENVSVGDELHGALRLFRDASKSFCTSSSEPFRRFSCRATSLLSMSYSSRFNSSGRVISGRGMKIPASRPRHVTRFGVLERRRPVALSRNSLTVLIVMWPTLVTIMRRRRFWAANTLGLSAESGGRPADGAHEVTTSSRLTGHLARLAVMSHSSAERGVDPRPVTPRGNNFVAWPRWSKRV
jgi:hypothetical protein